MHTDRIIRISQRMATVTIWLIVAIIILNATCWFFPALNITSRFGFGFSVFHSLFSEHNIDLSTFPWWQRTGGFLLSAIPLLACVKGLLHLRQLFRTYARGDFFSVAAAHHLGKVGRTIGAWIILSVLSEPLLTAWASMREPVGQRFFSVSFDWPYVIALFSAICISVIALILQRASELHTEHQQII